MTTHARYFGWRKEPEGRVSAVYQPRAGLTRVESVRHDLLPQRINDQGPTPTCVGFTLKESLELLALIEGHPLPPLSGLSAYWHACAIDGFQHDFAGAYISSGAKAAQGVGVCTDAEWPLIEHSVQARWNAMSSQQQDDYLRARVTTRPPMTSEISGIKFADVQVQRIASGPDAAMDAIQVGHVPMLGIQVTDAFLDCNSAETIPAPKPGDVRRGGHAIEAVGYDRFGSRVRIKNHWSENWGDNGYAWADPEWFSNREASDVIVLVRTAQVSP